jgi:hypothetical protein
LQRTFRVNQPVKCRNAISINKCQNIALGLFRTKVPRKARTGNRLMEKANFSKLRANIRRRARRPIIDHYDFIRLSMTPFKGSQTPEQSSALIQMRDNDRNKRVRARIIHRTLRQSFGKFFFNARS